MDKDERTKYWNEDYLSYWKARVAEANTSKTKTSYMVAGDAKTSTDDLYLNVIRLLAITKSDRVLELGCGFGRSLFSLCRAALQVAAVDISEQMISAAREVCQEENVSFHVSPSETLPFSEKSFDVIVCYAAFDAMYQTEALLEMNRVSRSGARILITGKNDNYPDDDAAAVAAEVGARAKNHPNYFTDVKKLVGCVERFGFSIETRKYYQRRGDFANEIYNDTIPEMFYEYLFVLRKVTDAKAMGNVVISNEVSKTYARRIFLA